MSSFDFDTLSFVALRTSAVVEHSSPLRDALVSSSTSHLQCLKICRMESWSLTFILSGVILSFWGRFFLEMPFVKYECPCDIQISISRLLYPLGSVLWWLFSKGHVSYCRFVEMAFRLSFTVLELDSDWQFVLWSWVQIQNALFPVHLNPTLNPFYSLYCPLPLSHINVFQWNPNSEFWLRSFGCVLPPGLLGYLLK